MVTYWRWEKYKIKLHPRPRPGLIAPDTSGTLTLVYGNLSKSSVSARYWIFLNVHSFLLKRTELHSDTSLVKQSSADDRGKFKISFNTVPFPSPFPLLVFSCQLYNTDLKATSQQLNQSENKRQQTLFQGPQKTCYLESRMYTIQVYNIKPSICQAFIKTQKHNFDDGDSLPQKKILTAQTDNFQVPWGKLVASQVLSSGEWKLRVKPGFLINKHQVGPPRRGAAIKANTAYLNMKIHFSFPSTKKPGTKEMVNLSGRHKLKLTEWPYCCSHPGSKQNKENVLWIKPNTHLYVKSNTASALSLSEPLNKSF